MSVVILLPSDGQDRFACVGRPLVPEEGRWGGAAVGGWDWGWESFKFDTGGDDQSPGPGAGGTTSSAAQSASLGLRGSVFFFVPT